MIDDLLSRKAATIERCVCRAREEYDRGPATFATDYTRQHVGRSDPLSLPAPRPDR